MFSQAIRPKALQGQAGIGAQRLSKKRDILHGTGKLQGGSHELGVVFLVYLRHGPASSRAPIRLFSLLGSQLGELLEGALQAPRYVGPQHLAGLGPDNLSGVDRTPRDEDERSGQRTDLALTN